jgi:hypothetical protein
VLPLLFDLALVVGPCGLAAGAAEVVPEVAAVAQSQAGAIAVLAAGSGADAVAAGAFAVPAVAERDFGAHERVPARGGENDAGEDERPRQRVAGVVVASEQG